MKDNFDKYIIVGIVILFILYIANMADNNKEDKYKIENKKYTVCGENIYITNFTNNNELNGQALLDEIECLCKNKC